MSDKEKAIAAGDELLQSVRAARPRHMTARAPQWLWLRLVPELGKLETQQMHDAVGAAMMDAVPTRAFKFTALVGLLSILVMVFLLEASLAWCVVPAILNSVVKRWLAVRILKARLPGLLANGEHA
ncbi:hypothetical protein [Pseudoduganella sp. OTU4001]|uniref:hypothetical protein n=1 Tax=Pseudoduganella sp. OTU4001 TaxID=3043854 RepID=UPI00313D5015